MFRLPLVLLLLAAPSALHAQDGDWTSTAGAGYASMRVFRGVERSGSAAQASAEITGGGFRGGIWTSQPFRGNEPGETDLNAGYAFKLAGPLTLGVAATQYIYSRTHPGGTRQSTEAGIRADWTAANGITATLAGFHDFRLRADTIQLGAAYSVALKGLGAYLDLESYAGWTNGADLLPDAAGPRIRDSYAYCGAGAKLPYRVGPHTMLVAGVNVSGVSGQSRRWSPTGAPGAVRAWLTLAVNVDF